MPALNAEIAENVMPKNLSIVPKSEIARCPRCRQFMNSSERQCPNCKAFFTADQLRDALKLQTKGIRERARANNRRATVYGVFSLVGCIILAVPVLVVKLHLWRAEDRANVADVLGHLWNVVERNMLAFAVLFVALPVLTVVIMRWRREED